MHYMFGAYHLDTQRYELHHAGVLVPLRPKVFQVLAYLVAQHDRVVGKEELLEALWPGQFVGDVGLNTYIMEVRKALGNRRPPHRGPTGSRPRAGEYGKAGGALGKRSRDTATMRKRGPMGDYLPQGLRDKHQDPEERSDGKLSRPGIPPGSRGGSESSMAASLKPVVKSTFTFRDSTTS